jgi:hypothetical protein
LLAATQRLCSVQDVQIGELGLFLATC